MTHRIIPVLFLIVALLSACGGAQPAPTLDMNLVMTAALGTVNASSTQTALALPTNTATATPPPTETPIPAPPAFEPTTILSATVAVPANIRFGPGVQYAGPGGLRTGKAVEVIGRNAAGDWLLIREVGGRKSSWIYAVNLKVQGDIAALAIAPVILPITPNYQPPANIQAVRAGDQVQVRWDSVSIPLKDMYLDSAYFIEAWVCYGGQIAYSIFAVKETAVVIPDQAGCAEASRALLYTTTKEGYSQPVPIPWPAH
ncbi:MAG: hypothetical protein HFACDABA_00217 [Anaerolineales bacterium]|nr:hypothetical protein [Anaerolineales bacterium]